MQSIKSICFNSSLIRNVCVLRNVCALNGTDGSKNIMWSTSKVCLLTFFFVWYLFTLLPIKYVLKCEHWNFFPPNSFFQTHTWLETQFSGEEQVSLFYISKLCVTLTFIWICIWFEIWKVTCYVETQIVAKYFPNCQNHVFVADFVEIWLRLKTQTWVCKNKLYATQRNEIMNSQCIHICSRLQSDSNYYCHL